jgi:hypothetical protein
MNADLLASVRRAIARHPDRFCAAQWAFARNAERVRTKEDVSPIGFRCCIAGHVLLESSTRTERDLLREGGFHTGGALWEQAAAALGLAKEQCRELFFPSQWDHPFKKQYYLCTREEEAQVAMAYIDFFLQKHRATDERQRASGRSETFGVARPPRTAVTDGRSHSRAEIRSRTAA